jgi:hypothetical protein
MHMGRNRNRRRKAAHGRLTGNANTGNHKGEPSQGAQRSANAADPAVAESKDHIDAEAHQNHRTYQYKQPPDWVSRSIAIIALIVSGAAVAIYYLQLREMEMQVANADRPWVGLATSNTLEIDSLQLSPKMAVTGHYVIRNFGNRPALRVNAIGAASATWGEVVLEWGVPRCIFPAFITAGDKNLPSQGQLLFPNETSPEKFGPATTDPHPGLTKIWIAGCITYLDQFTHPHWTRYCYEVGDGKQSVDKDSPISPCQLYNDTDETENQNMTQEVNMIKSMFARPSKK